MALLDLDKIVLNRTVGGVACPVCAGVLEEVFVKPGWLWKLIRKKGKKTMRYRCQDCSRRYKMAEVQ